MRCPHCDSTNLKEVSFDPGPRDIYIGYDCLNCEAKLTAVFEFTWWEDPETGEMIF